MILPILIFVLINSIGAAVGFEDVNITDVPYHVSIRNKQNQHICSGAITRSDVVIASGYCSELKDISHIVAGTVYPSTSREKSKQTSKISATNVVTTLWSGSEHTVKAYLVVFYLEKELEFNDYVQPIGLFAGMNPTGIVSVTGFTKVNNIVRLRSNDLIISNDNCSDRLYDKNENMWYLSCITTKTKEEMCYSLEKSSLFICNDGTLYGLCGFSMPSVSDYVCELNNVTSPYHAHFTIPYKFRSYLEDIGAL